MKPIQPCIYSGINIKSFENIKILMETFLLDIIGIMLMRTWIWIMGTREITAPHSGGEYYSEYLIVTNFHIILREVIILGIHIIAKVN